MLYTPKYFELYEVLPEVFFNNHIGTYGDKLWKMFDNRILITIDNLRNNFGKMVCNTWIHNQQIKHKYRGYRSFNCEIGSILSQHKFGRAIDLIPLENDVKEIRHYILKNQFDERFKYITCMEMPSCKEKELSWLHVDCRNHDKNNKGILIVYPK